MRWWQWGGHPFTVAERHRPASPPTHRPIGETAALDVGLLQALVAAQQHAAAVGAWMERQWRRWRRRRQRRRRLESVIERRRGGAATHKGWVLLAIRHPHRLGAHRGAPQQGNRQGHGQSTAGREHGRHALPSIVAALTPMRQIALGACYDADGQQHAGQGRSQREVGDHRGVLASARSLESEVNDGRGGGRRAVRSTILWSRNALLRNCCQPGYPGRAWLHNVSDAAAGAPMRQWRWHAMGESPGMVS